MVMKYAPSQLAKGLSSILIHKSILDSGGSSFGNRISPIERLYGSMNNAHVKATKNRAALETKNSLERRCL